MLLVPKAGEEPPCFLCKMPQLDEDNLLPWEVFSFCSSEVNSIGMDGAILGIKFESIDRAIEHLGVPRADRWNVFDKVVRLGKVYAEVLQENKIASMPADQRPKATPVAPPPFYNSYDEMIEETEGGEDEEDF